MVAQIKASSLKEDSSVSTNCQRNNLSSMENTLFAMRFLVCTDKKHAETGTAKMMFEVIKSSQEIIQAKS